MTDLIIWNCSAKSDPITHMPDFLTGFYPVRTCGPYQIASWLRLHNYTVKVIDFCDVMSIKNLISITLKYVKKSTLAIGLSTTFFSFSKEHLYDDKNFVENYSLEPEWLVTARTEIERLYPSIKWIVGGKNTWVCNDDTWIKFKGDSEDLILKFLNELSNQKTTQLSVFDIKDSCKMFHEYDFITKHDVLPIELGRGCMFKCKFCSWDQIGKKPGTYLKNFDLIRKEILDNYYKWGTTRFTYVDDTVNESVDKIKILADIAKSVPFKLEWIGYLRADLIWSYPETVELLRESGLRSAFFGIESFNKDVSKLVGKGWSGKHAKDYLLKLKELWGNDITFELGLIVGLPGQTMQELKEDIKWLIDNEIYSWWLSSLVLQKNPTWKNDFNKNSAQYGFTFPNENNIFYWENGIWNAKNAFDAYVELREMSKNYTTISSFGLSNFASVGYEFNDLMYKKYKDLPKDEIYKKRDSYLENYIIKNLQ